MDFWQQPAADLGQAGPDKGQGGKYFVIVGPGRQTPQVDGHFIVECKTNNVFIGIRVLEPGESKIKAAMERYRIYPYAAAQHPAAVSVRQRPQSKSWSQMPSTGHAVLAKP